MNETENENKNTNRYKIEADTHCHTMASTHAYGTITENVTAAASMGLKALAITNHGPSLPDAPHAWHFHNMRILPKQMQGVTLLKGIEANILDVQGNLDLEEGYLKNLDWVIASFHKQTFKVSTPADHTQALIAAVNNPYVDLLGHPDAPEYPFDIKAVVRECRAQGKMVEMNNSSFYVRKGGEETCRQIALECMDQGVSVVVNSDAHGPWDIGRFSTVCRMLESVSFPEELVFNTKVVRLYEYIKAKKGRV